MLNDYFTYSLYVNVCRSLFERHKLLLSFMLAVKTLQHAGSIDPKEWRFLLAGPTSQKRASSAGAESMGLDNPAPDWLTEKAWGELLGLADLPAYHGLDEHVAGNLEHYKAIFDSNEVRRQLIGVVAALADVWRTIQGAGCGLGTAQGRGWQLLHKSTSADWH